MPIDQKLTEAANIAAAAAPLMDQFVNGDENTIIQGAGGAYPSQAKAAKEAKAQIVANFEPEVASINEHAAHVTAEANRAQSYVQGVADEGARQVQAVQSEGAAQVKKVTDTGAVKVSSVNSAGDTQVQRVQAEGTTQEARVTAEGDTQNRRVIVQGDTQESRVTAEGNTQTARASAEANRAASEASAAESHKNSTQAIANKFGDVNGAITEATAQADRSKSEADRSTAQANISTSGGNKAKTEADRAKAEADRATAVVTGGNAVQKPTAGKIPLADSKGHLDINWTPLLAAMYPYSGVIGSVDKGELFYFNQSSSAYSNRLFLRGDQKFNIGGRFVRINTSGVNIQITLPEAESTAARAIAFDDIFLDWNGTVTTYRSITPHRTTTGYDRDKIATEHGYSKIQTGLYKTGDTYALLLGRVARRNQGAYHPVFNPEGTCYLLDNTETSASWRYWYQSNSCHPLSTAECFTKKSNNGSVDGKIGNNSGGTGSSDNKFYDAIYADDFTPLYYSAKNVIDRKAMLDDNVARAGAGETFSAAEGCQFTGLLVTPQGSSTSLYCQEGSPIAPDGMAVGETCYISIEITGGAVLASGVALNTIYECVGSPVGQAVVLKRKSDSLAGWITSGNTNQLRIRVFHIKPRGFLSNSARPQFHMVDIIGSLEAMPDEWKTNGIPGNWLAVGEEGESLIPDGTPKNYKVSPHKVLNTYQVLKTSDKGVTWADVTSTYKASLESNTNSMGSQSFAATDVVMVFYLTSANPFELAVNSAVHATTNRGTVSNYFNAADGSVLGSNLIGKVTTNSAFGDGNFNVDSTFIKSLFTPHAVPRHIELFANGNGNKSPLAYKVLPYLSGSYLQIIYKELKHNGTSWGDDNKFNIVNKQSTVTDLNGETVIVGQKRVELPYQFDGVTY